jgi:hypothetical protein
MAEAIGFSELYRVRGNDTGRSLPTGARAAMDGCSKGPTSMPSIYARQGMPCWKEDSLIEAWHRSPLYCHHFVSAWAKHPVRNTGRAHIVGITLQGKERHKRLRGGDLSYAGLRRGGKPSFREKWWVM